MANELQDADSIERHAVSGLLKSVFELDRLTEELRRAHESAAQCAKALRPRGKAGFYYRRYLARHVMKFIDVRYEKRSRVRWRKAMR